MSQVKTSSDWIYNVKLKWSVFPFNRNRCRLSTKPTIIFYIKYPEIQMICKYYEWNYLTKSVDWHFPFHFALATHQWPTQWWGRYCDIQKDRMKNSIVFSFHQRDGGLELFFKVSQSGNHNLHERPWYIISIIYLLLYYIFYILYLLYKF